MTVQEAKAKIENLEKHFRNAKSGTALYEVLGVFVTLEDLCIALESMEEVEQYRALGTVEELKEAREKQIPKKPIEKEFYNMSHWICPICEGGLFEDQTYCDECGQAIDWEEGGTSD